MPATHRMTPTLLNMGFTGAKLRKRNIGSCGSKNAAMMANISPKLCNRCPLVSCFTPIDPQSKSLGANFRQITVLSRFVAPGYFV
jgi:hypothetical protein